MLHIALEVSGYSADEVGIEQVGQLQSILKPLMLRRLKEDVVSFAPPAAKLFYIARSIIPYGSLNCFIWLYDSRELRPAGSNANPHMPHTAREGPGEIEFRYCT